MIRLTGLGLALVGVSSAAAGQSTDFGVRTVPPAEVRPIGLDPFVQRSTPLRRFSSGLSSAAALASRWGRVTSMFRTPAHNRLVGGVANSFHLSGRAIDIVRRPGVRHADIETAFRNAGYRLIESLDERDHSHFAFDFGGTSVTPHQQLRPVDSALNSWKVVYAPGTHSR